MTSTANDPVTAAEHRARRLIGPAWTTDDIPDLTGTHAVITGGTRGLGLATARLLARHGARLTITGTDEARAAEVARGLVDAAGEPAPARGLGLDLADLSSVERAAGRIDEPVDLLINNAGVMWGPYRAAPSGVERQLATNFLGHFALTGRLLANLLAAPRARVVNLSSTYHRFGRLDRAELDLDPARYRANRAYGTSKLAMLVFARELGRRADERHWNLTALAAHPGYADTGLQTLQLPRWQRPVQRAVNRAFGVSPERGAEPIACAATLPGLPSGVLIGPSRLGGYRGGPGIASTTRRSKDPAAAALLWEWASAKTGQFGP